ncbi:MAG: hypothetical protein ACPG5T_09845, partial [Endozoicomonas sp.]
MSDYLKAIRHWLDDPGLVRNLGKPLIQSTEKLATQLVSGAINHIWVVDIGSTGFGRELTNRAGGLAAIKLLDRPEQLTARDLVIAADHGLDVNDQLDCYQKVLDSGASLVLMGSSHFSVSQGVRATVFLDNLLGQSPSYGFEDRFCPRDTTLNSILAWCFLAELVSACVREGQMPVMYGSAFQAGGADRAGLYARDGLFHNPGDFNVYPLGAGVCCQLFMGQLRNSLDRIMETQMPLMAEVVQWYQESLDKGGELWLGVESHLLAQQVKGNGNPGFFQYLEEPLSDNNLGQYLLAPNVYTHLGYFTYP